MAIYSSALSVSIWIASSFNDWINKILVFSSVQTSWYQSSADSVHHNYDDIIIIFHCSFCFNTTFLFQ